MEPEKLGKVTCDELIRTQIQGKRQAIPAYDSILWKIRSGYILVLYGALSLLIGLGRSNFSAAANTDIRYLLLIVLILVWCFSLSALLLDVGFLRGKLRVVAAHNDLYELAVDLALGRRDLQKVDTELKLKQLLHISGEELKSNVDRDVFRNRLLWILPLYFGTPIVVTIIYIGALVLFTPFTSS